MTARYYQLLNCPEICRDAGRAAPELFPASPPAAICWARALLPVSIPKFPAHSQKAKEETRAFREQNNQQAKPRKTLVNLYFLQLSPELAAVLKALSRLGIHSLSEFLREKSPSYPHDRMG